MREKIEELYRQCQILEPDRKVFDHINERSTTFAFDFMESLNDVKAYISDQGTGEGIKEYDIEEEGVEIEKLLDALSKNVTGNGLNPASGGHLGYIPGGGVYPAAVGDYLAAVMNSYAGVFFGSAGAVRMENLLIRWMCKIIGFPSSALGNLTSGGSIANLIAMTTARDKKLKHSDEYKNAVIYLTEQVHHSVTKAIRIAGFGYAHIRFVPIDDMYRMDVDQLENLIKEDEANGLNPFLVVASAGTTDTGAVDPMKAIGKVCKKHDLWFHVDGAYGGFFILSDAVKHRFEGVELADSFTIDPHKGLFLPYGVGAVLIKDVDALNQAHYYQANYMQDAVEIDEEPSPADLSPELTKHFRGLRMWLPLKLFGIKPFKAALEEKIWLCRYFREEVQKIEGIEVGPDPDLSVALWRLKPKEGDANEANRWLARKIVEDGRVFMSSTTIDGEVWMRIAVLSFRTHIQTIEKALEMINEIVSNELSFESESFVLV